MKSTLNIKSNQIVDKLYPILSIIILGLGIAIRIIVYLQNRSFFLDEANVCRNIIEKSFIGFFSPLDYDQFAPPFWLICIKITSLLFGNNEYSLRLFPLIIGILSIFLFYHISHKIIQSKIAILFINFVFAFNLILIRYATEVKPYGMDLFITLILFYFVLSFQAKKLNAKRVLFWSSLGGFAIWFSMPSIFILSGIGFYFMYTLIKQNEERANILKSFYPIIFIGLSWILHFGLYYYLVLSKGVANDVQQYYHVQHFLPFVPLTVEEFQIWISIHHELIRSVIGVTIFAIVFGISMWIMGFLSLWKNPKFILFSIPLFFCWLASSLELYALWPRLSLFYLPLSLLLIGLGIEKLSSWIPSNWRLILIPILIVVASYQWGYKYVYEPLLIEEIKPIMKAIKNEAIKNDFIYVNARATPAFSFYTNYHDHKNQEFSFQENQIYYAEWNTQDPKNEIGNKDRFWIVITYSNNDNIQNILNQFKGQYIIEEKKKSKKVNAYLLNKK